MRKKKQIIRLMAGLLILCLLIPIAAGAQTGKFGTLLIFQQDWEARWPSVSPGIDEIPQYFQTDYFHIAYRRGTIASGGCGIVSLAMVSTYLLDRVYTPDGLAERYSYLSGSNVDRVNAISQDLKLPFVKMATKWSQVVQALKAGQIAILLLNGKSALTKDQHFVVLTGITEEGKILVHDPYEPNYDEYPLGFAVGFAEKYLEPGFDGAWIYEKQPRDAAFDQMVLEAYTGIRGKNAVLELWFPGE